MMTLYEQTIDSMHNINIFIIGCNFLIHLIFAAGIAKDAGNLTKKYISTQIIPPFAWVLATILGGLMPAVVYWIIHHSSLFRK